MIIENSKKININEILCNSISLNKEDVELLKENNIEVACWGIKNKAELKRVAKLGVDVIIYDSAYDAKKVLKNE